MSSVIGALPIIFNACKLGNVEGSIKDFLKLADKEISNKNIDRLLKPREDGPA